MTYFGVIFLKKSTLNIIRDHMKHKNVAKNHITGYHSKPEQSQNEWLFVVACISGFLKAIEKLFYAF